MKNQVQLIAYADRLSGGGFRELQRLLEGPFAGLFGGLHLLPFFWPIDGADAGFDPIDHTRTDPRLGSWHDLARLAEGRDLIADLVVNHVSVRSPQFEDFRRKGDASPYAGLFLTLDRVFPSGAAESDLLRIRRLRGDLPFTTVRLGDGTERVFWSTFTSDQIDIDVRSAQGRAYLEQVLDRLAAAGVRVIRLDAAGFTIKEPGTRCFMIPETLDFIAALRDRARAQGIEVLAEIRGHHEDQIRIARLVDRVYDFALPALVLHALYTASAGPLKHWLTMSPRNALTVLDTHDGIGVTDVAGLLSSEEIDGLVETIHQRSRGASREASGTASHNVDLSQINCTYYDALGRRDDEYLIARALQFFSPGVPQVYYVGLLAGANDMDLVHRTKVGRDINRHYYSPPEIAADLERPVVRKLLDLIRLRNTHPAFDGEFHLLNGTDHEISIEWRNGAFQARLDVDLRAVRAEIECSRRADFAPLSPEPQRS